MRSRRPEDRRGRPDSCRSTAPPALRGELPAAVTLTPWDPQEIWPLLATALAKRPAVIVPFVTRPNERVPNRAALGLAAPAEAVSGVYLLSASAGKGRWNNRAPGKRRSYAFVEDALPLLEKEGKGHFLGSGQGPVVLAEAGLDGKGQYAAIREYVAARSCR